jgi:8-oxo-dGTP pyrophosphatase MutT (NUDIX family)
MDLLRTHFVTAGAVVINEKKEVLLKNDPRRGWELPAGHVEPGEAIPDGVIREVKEETGIDIEIVKFCGLTQNLEKRTLHTWWMARPVGGEFIVTGGSMDVGYFDPDEALRMISRADFRENLVLCLNEELHPFFATYPIGDGVLASSLSSTLGRSGFVWNGTGIGE